MKTRFVPPDGKTDRVGNRLINAGNAELAGRRCWACSTARPHRRREAVRPSRVGAR